MTPPDCVLQWAAQWARASGRFRCSCRTSPARSGRKSAFGKKALLRRSRSIFSARTRAKNSSRVSLPSIPQARCWGGSLRGSAGRLAFPGFARRASLLAGAAPSAGAISESIPAGMLPKKSVIGPETSAVGLAGAVAEAEAVGRGPHAEPPGPHADVAEAGVVEGVAAGPDAAAVASEATVAG